MLARLHMRTMYRITGFQCMWWSTGWHLQLLSLHVLSGMSLCFCCQYHGKWQWSLEILHYWRRSKNWFISRGPKSYLRQPVIASPVIQQKMEEPQTAVPPLLGLICVAYGWLLADGCSCSNKLQQLIFQSWYNVQSLQIGFQSFTVCLSQLPMTLEGCLWQATTDFRERIQVGTVSA